MEKLKSGALNTSKIVEEELKSTNEIVEVIKNIIVT